MIKSIGGQLGGLIKDKGLKGDLIRGGAGSIAIKLASTVLGLLTGVFVARALGPEHYGIYAYVMALVSLLSLPALFGLPSLIVRETAKAQAHEQWGLMRGLWRWSSTFTGGLAVFIAIVAFFAALLVAGRFSAEQLQTMFWGVLLVPLMTLGNLRGAALRGLHKVLQGQLPESVVRPVLFLSLIGLLAWLKVDLTAPHAMAMNALASLFSFMLGAWLLWIARPEGLRQKPVSVVHGREWLKSALPLALTSALSMVNHHADIIMIGWFSSATDVGIYRVATSGAALVVFGLTTINMVVGPYYAKFHARKEKEQIQKLATNSARVVIAMTLPVVIAFLFFGEPLIGFIFGQEYLSAYLSLAIISVGQLMNASFGSVGLLLVMTGHERETTKGVAVATLSNVVLNAVLIPIYGIEGAAFATAFTLLTWNVLLWIAVARHLGIDTLAVPLAKRLHIGKKW